MTAGIPACGWRTPAAVAGGLHPALMDPWEAAAGMGAGTVLAVLTATEGPAYRDLGTAMAIAPDGRVAGAITSGCVEADLVLQAAGVRDSGRVRRLRYGRGSPFFDMKLPCGGGIEVTLLPLRDPGVLTELAACRAARRTVGLHLTPAGRLALLPGVQTGEDGFTIGFRPPVRHVIFGAGAEALVFAGLVARLGYDHLLLSHDPATLASAAALGCAAAELTPAGGLAAGVAAARIDAATAVTLFYHDHDYEPAILGAVLAGPAFYVGAQGSRAAQATRQARLAEMGLPADRIARLHGPIGMIPSTRDPQSLAISVLAEITEAAAALATGP